MPALFQTLWEQIFGNAHPENSFLFASLIFLRMMMIVNQVPFFGAQKAPGPLRVGLAVLLTLLFAIIFKEQIPKTGELYPGLIALLAIKEILIGFLIAYCCSLIFYAVEAAGQLMDTVRGVNQIQMMLPGVQDRSSALGAFNFQLMVALFLTSYLHPFFFEALALSFVRLPPLALPSFLGSDAFFLTFIPSLFSLFFKIALLLSVPILILSFFVEMAFGFLNRIAPQINAFFLSIPAKALGGLLVFWAAFSLLVSQSTTYAAQILSLLQKALEGVATPGFFQ